MTSVLRYLTCVGAALALVVSDVPAFAAPPPGSPGQPARPTTYVDGHLQARMVSEPNGQLPVIVQLRTPPSPPSTPAATAAATAAATHKKAADDAVGLLRQHGKAGSSLPVLGGASGRLDANAIRALASSPNVAAIYEDLLAPCALRSSWP